jgi:hypothetical protein
MDKRIVGLAGVISGLASLDGAQAAAIAAPNADGPPTARSYADLLDPIPNALALLRAADAAAVAGGLAQSAGTNPDVKLAYYHHHHHHWYYHHHHRYWRRYYHHHHHHHHHHSY